MQIKKFEEREDEYIYLKMKSEDFRIYCAYSSFIEKHLALRNPVPPRVFKKFQSLFTHKEEDANKYYDRLIDELTTIVTKHFKGDKNYDFLITKKVVAHDIPTTPLDIELSKYKRAPRVYSFDDMVRYVAAETLWKKLYGKLPKKEDCIKFAYKAIDNSLKEWKMENLYSHYKISVVAGYIAFSMDYAWSKDLSPEELGGEEPTNAQIFKAVTHATIKFKKNTRKKKGTGK